MISSFPFSKKASLKLLSFALALGCAPTAVAQTGTQTPVIISGSVFQDGDGGTINGTPIGLLANAPNSVPIYVYVLSADSNSNTIVGKTMVDSSGTNVGSYTIPVQPNTNYNIRISTSNLQIGNQSPTYGFLSSFVPTAEGSGTIGDGQPDFGVAINTSQALTINFAINTRPKSVDYTIANPQYDANNRIEIPAAAFTASDAEDGNYAAGLAGRPVDLFQATGGTLIYNGMPINFATASSATRISAFNVSLLRLQRTNNATAVSFAFATVDNAGTAELTPSTIQVQATPLAVSLVSFDARRQGTDVLVAWTAAAEADGTGFWVERSTDGKFFREVGHLASVTTGTTLVNYRFEDTQLPGGSLYYRLRQTSLGGQYLYSKTVVVAGEKAMENNATLRLYPNPAVAKVQLALGSEAAPEGTASFMDASGRMVLQQPVQPANNASINVSSLPAGLYFVQYRNAAGAPQTARLTIQ